MLKKIFSDELFKGSFILLIMLNIFNILNYVFHFAMGRLLGPEDYGILVVLMSFTYLFSTPSEAIQGIMTKYTSRFNSKGELGKIKYMFFKGLKKAFFFSFLLYILFMIVSVFLSPFLRIDYSLFLIIGIILFFYFLTPFMKGVLQGQKKFLQLGTTLIIEAFIKISLGIILVIIGFKIYGAVSAVVLSIGLGFLISFLFIKDILNSKTEKQEFNQIYIHSLPYFISLLSIMLIFTLDVIIAKRFFSPELAGLYSAASVIGKVIYLGVFGISKAMFPLTAENQKDIKKSNKIMLKALLFSTLISIIAVLLYALFPSLIIRLLYGSEFIEISHIIIFTGLAFAFLSLTNIVILYGLSIDRIKKSSITLLIFVIIEIFLLSVFSTNLTEFSIALLFLNIIVFLYSLFLVYR